MLARRGALDDAHCVLHRVTDEGDLLARVAQQIAKGDVVGWFPDRAGEARRAVLIDPRRADAGALVKEKLGEAARQLEVLVLGEAVAEWLVVDDRARTVAPRETKVPLIPAVAHASRVWIIRTTETADRMDHGLLQAFRAVSGVPLLLATSCPGDPPNTPAGALDCFLQTSMDVIVVGNLMIQRV